MSITSFFFFVAMTSLFVMTSYILSMLPPYRGVIDAVCSKRSFHCELEGLRGLLAFSVVIHHAVVWYLMLYHGFPETTGANANLFRQLGVASVTLFFFITGFLFWSKLMVKPAQSFWPFMASRLRRLGPGYLGAMCFLLVLVAGLSHFHLQTTLATLGRDLLQVLWGETPLLNGLSYTPWLWGVTWTLRYECLFYLIIPFLGWFAGTLRKSLLFVGVCGFLYVSNCLANRVHMALPAVYGGFLRHLFFTFSIGILAAQLVKIPEIKSFCSSTWAAAISVALLIATFYLMPATYGLPESLSLAFPFLAVASGCTFWGALSSRPVLFMGQISYSVYLIHPLILGSILLPMYRLDGGLMQSVRIYWTIMFCMTPVIVVIATLWHRTFELPFLIKRAGGAVPLQTDAASLLVRSAFTSGPIPQPHVHAFVLRADAEPVPAGLFPSAASLIRRADFLPRRSRRQEQS